MEHIQGPQGPIPVQRDTLGYPSIFARDRNEAAFALGHLHAQDRFVQIHLALLIAQGRVQEFIGPSPFFRRIDRAMRRLNPSADLEEQSKRLAPQTRALFDAYCAGWASHALTRRRPAILVALGVPTQLLRPASILLLHRQAAYLGLASNQERAEIIIAELAHQGVSPELFSLLLGEHARGFDPGCMKRCVPPDPTPTLPQTVTAGGSNAWAVSAARSATGGALLANDFHLQIGTFPPTCYAAHLELPNGRYVQGTSIAGSPLFLSGRTNDLGWGATYAGADSIDISVERCQDGNYFAKDRWLPLSSRTEEVKIRGQQTERWTFWEHEAGIIDGDATQPGEYPCFQWTNARHVGSETFDALAELETLSTAHEGARCVSRIQAWSTHFVFADSRGDIAYAQCGGVAKRAAGWSGAYPRAAWNDATRSAELLPIEVMPIVENPPEGVIVSANEGVPGAHGEALCTLPQPKYRAQRLRQLLEPISKHTLDDSATAQYDEQDLSAAELLAVWAPLLPPEPLAQDLARWAAQQAPLASADDRLRLGRFHALHREVTRALLAEYISDEQAKTFTRLAEIPVIFQHHLDQALLLKTPQLEAERLRGLLATAWPRALSEPLEFPLRGKFKNFLLDGRLPAGLGTFLGLDSAEIALPGGPNAPFQSHIMDFWGMKVLVGPLFHFLFDMKQRGGWYNFAGGASEQLRGPGYGKGLPDWRAGRYLPLGSPSGQPPRPAPRAAKR